MHHRCEKWFNPNLEFLVAHFQGLRLTKEHFCSCTQYVLFLLVTHNYFTFFSDITAKEIHKFRSTRKGRYRANSTEEALWQNYYKKSITLIEAKTKFYELQNQIFCETTCHKHGQQLIINGFIYILKDLFLHLFA